ncbi:MAG: GHKL domain-containing protein [Oscillospiraceae bacterium]|jgi:two-component system sensor histidine kinase AgrC|nr:GHKL domain-containing protein [Oscillospiraceae bacterium]
MPTLVEYLRTYADTTLGHAMLVVYLFVVLEERGWRRVKKLPMLFLSPLTVASVNIFLYYVLPGATLIHFCGSNLLIVLLCTLWVGWAWKVSLWRALSAVAMAGLFQVSVAALTRFLFRNILQGNEGLRFAAVSAIAWALVLLSAVLLYRLRFGHWFRLLLEEGTGQRRMALFLFVLLYVMEAFYLLQRGLQPAYFPLYYVLVLVMAALAAGLVVYLAQWLDAVRKMEAQQGVIAQQQLYEQELEAIRREVRAFRHDYKNMLAGLSQQAGAGETEALCAALSELDAGFDRRIGEKIQVSTQVGNLRIPQVRSLLLSKLTAMGERGVDCRLEVLYPVERVGMDVWDFVRCLGILLDNAAEAALETETPWVEIVLLAQGEALSLRVSNPYAGRIDPVKMWEEGWSTKGEGRGLGLPGYQRILEEYRNAGSAASWAGDVFVQDLTIGGRP